MSRITGKDALGLFEAYQAVYNPQELTEEQIWEEVENWVNSLLEEGHDLSGYTWEDMYEAYVDEERAPGVKAYKPQNVKPLPKAKPLSGETGDRSGYGPDEKFKDWKDKATPSSTLNRRGGETETVSQRMNREKPYNRRMTGPLARAQGSRTASAVTRTTEGPGEPQAVTMPRIGRGEKPKVSKEIIRREQVDVYDLILSHLLDEGYANSVDAAEKIMVNMSEEWRESIVEDIRGAITYNPNTPIGRLKRRIKGSTPEKREARTRSYQGNKSDAAERYSGSQHSPYDDSRGDIPSLRGR